MEKRFTSKESNTWLRERMKKLGITSLNELSELTNIDRGSISRYFNQDREPSIHVIEPLCKALKVTPNELLIVLGAKAIDS